MKIHFLPQREFCSGLYRFDQILKALQNIQLIPDADPEAEFQPVPCILQSRIQTNRSPGQLLLLFSIVREQSRMPISAPEVINQFSGAQVCCVPAALISKFLDAPDEQGKAMLTNFHIITVGITAIVASATVDRAVQAVYAIPGKSKSYRIVCSFFYQSANENGLSSCSRFVRVGVVHLDVMHGSVGKHLLRFFPGVSIYCQVPGKTGRHIIAVSLFHSVIGEAFFHIGVNTHMSYSDSTGSPFTAGAGNLTSGDFIQCGRHMFAAVSVFGIRAGAVHALNPVAPQTNRYLIFLRTLYRSIIGLSVTDQ